ncbi:hypothetical protein CSC82_18185 [Rhodobacteraceae bacterium 4F10]|nr:hypothetical protein CSC82_18185 [Rhodobacteraceae bacterium 4F10]
MTAAANPKDAAIMQIANALVVFILPPQDAENASLLDVGGSLDGKLYMSKQCIETSCLKKATFDKF